MSEYQRVLVTGATGFLGAHVVATLTRQGREVVALVRDPGTAAARRIEALASEGVAMDGACGSRAVNGLIEAARRLALEPMTLDLRNSGDTAGPRDRVVGYGAYVAI